MTRTPEIIVLGGGTSAEREVSLASSRAVHASLSMRHRSQWMDLSSDALPVGLDPKRHVVFPVLHGAFGEDGGIQRMLEAEGFAYVGCDAASSALCMDKRRAKERAASAGVASAPAFYFDLPPAPDAAEIENVLGTAKTAIKPRCEGSSVGLQFTDSPDSLRRAIDALPPGKWMAEPRINGADLTVGVLRGRPMGVVEILPRDGGAYDYARKYTPGATEYRYPAELPESLTRALQEASVRVFKECGCRDFARVDFILTHRKDFYFLEINTIPGLTATSLLPKSASCAGYNFDALVDAMIAPALERYSVLLNC